MAMEMRQQIRMTQQLVMTPQLQQAIKLLQMTRNELQEVVSRELEENPILEETAEAEEFDGAEPSADHADVEESGPPKPDETFSEVAAGEETLRDWDSYLDGYNYSMGEQGGDDEERPSFENLLTRRGTLADHLLWQLRMGHFSDNEVRVAEEIIGNIDDDGLFCATVAETAHSCGVDDCFVEQVLARVQEFDPVGVAARSLQECLLLQARSLGMAGSVVESILLNHLKDLESRNYRQIARALRVDIEQVIAATRVIAGFDPHPGRVYGSDDAQYISPDIFVHKVGDDYVVMLNEEGLPNLRLSPYYLEARSGGSFDAKVDEYVGDKMRAAQWLIKSIQQRQRTIFRVAKSIVKFQWEFLERGVEGLRPLVLRDVAEDIGMHESTISRVTTNKYMQTPQGLFELKYFFNSGLSTSGGGDDVSSESVKSRIKEIIDREDPKKPLSDQRIAEILSGETVNIARRTVTKYREMMRIGSSSERRRHF
ncbi:RNA polymerase factor sigma-54 [Trichlorobacter ammonificans]|uniref:RNA polymerase sigma-54 factor n=1 Tax=Trichlorobacter ammonificans TaxID=2916410 RepID=A0ABM9D8J0_9BACT|nr:RNA polymerase factor sigma-54 [Trichlorobacter ammonificans]CAH2030701.1 RNA polymerase sigma-54 factor [Trichlorobacter ammonificans]